MLFDLVAPGDSLGLVTSSAAAITGLPVGIPVIATSNDKAVEALGAGLRDEGEALLSLGTYVATMTPGREVRASDDFWTNFAAEPRKFLYESHGVRRGMWTVSWFRDLVSSEGARYSEIELDEGAATVPPGAGGLVVALDWLAPPDEQSRRGAIVGFDGTQGRFHVYRAILEALAIETSISDARTRTALGRELTGLVVTGGGSGSSLMLSILAAVFGVPVRTVAVSDAAGIGAAIAAAVGTGMHGSWSEATTAMVRAGERVPVNPALRESYVPVVQRYASMLPRVRGIFADAD